MEAEQQQHRRGDPCVMVIFGATGDLTKRKLIPSLYNLASQKLLVKELAIVGFGIDNHTTDSFRDYINKDVKTFATGEVDPELWNFFLQHVYYVQGDFKDAAAYQRLNEMLQQVSKEHSIQPNFLYYLATAPMFFGEIIRQLNTAGITKEEGGNWRRVIIEKPFGHDLESARALNAEIRNELKERQIYRIDHYLGKETVQNILVFRFSNGIFEPVWNRRYVDHIQITSAETVGVEQRGGYYDKSGALRDMVPNHLFQLLTLTTMECPISFSADAVRDEQAKILHAVMVPTPEEVLSHTVRGQYDQGMLKDEKVPAYRTEPNVPADSNTETFVALKLKIENWRWADVPIYLRTGKRLAKRDTEITIQFRRAPFRLFRNTPIERLKANRIVLHIQPDEGIALQFGAKVPGIVMNLGSVQMDFEYSDYFGSRPSTGYERLIYDCMIGDQTLFQRADQVEAGWNIIQPVLDVWKALPPRSFPNYAAGSWGPKEADELLTDDGRSWNTPETIPREQK
jgi:glucose-6-phosphate 1-dehydrogenase